MFTVATKTAVVGFATGVAVAAGVLGVSACRVAASSKIVANERLRGVALVVDLVATMIKRL